MKDYYFTHFNKLCFTHQLKQANIINLNLNKSCLQMCDCENNINDSCCVVLHGKRCRRYIIVFNSPCTNKDYSNNLHLMILFKNVILFNPLY